MKLLFTILLTLFLTGCFTTQKEFEDKLSSWIGYTEEDLVASWGIPQRVYELKGKRYLTWVNTGQMTLPGTQPTYQTSIIGGYATTTAIGGTAPMNIMLNCERTFVIENGRIQTWSWKGNNCY
ncbi:hypothetical protein OAY88_01180 [Alphaproteobacteria bacterium]|nr:hypothetical protein [Alphaproteobacteria bacterium]